MRTRRSRQDWQSYWRRRFSRFDLYRWYLNLLGQGKTGAKIACLSTLKISTMCPSPKQTKLMFSQAWIPRIRVKICKAMHWSGAKQLRTLAHLHVCSFPASERQGRSHRIRLSNFVCRPSVAVITERMWELQYIVALFTQVDRCSLLLYAAWLPLAGFLELQRHTGCKCFRL